MWINAGGPGQLKTSIYDADGKEILGANTAKNSQIVSGCSNNRGEAPAGLRGRPRTSNKQWWCEDMHGLHRSASDTVKELGLVGFSRYFLAARKILAVVV